MTDDTTDDRPDAAEASTPDEPMDSVEATETSEAPEGEDQTAASGDGDADEAPLDDLARRIREGREGQTSEDLGLDELGLDETDLDDADFDLPGDEDLFESVDVADVDPEAVWEAFVEEETSPEDHLGVGVEATTVDPEAREHVVPKRAYCQRCPHFTEPPEMACTHRGTVIVEVVDADQFRVQNCPMVNEDGSAPTFE